MEQLGSHRTYFREIWHLSIFRKIVEKIQNEIGQEHRVLYRGADKSLARTGRKQATATEDFDFHLSYL
jgi:hypothetical protein